MGWVSLACLAYAWAILFMASPPVKGWVKVLALVHQKGCAWLLGASRNRALLQTLSRVDACESGRVGGFKTQRLLPRPRLNRHWAFHGAVLAAAWPAVCGQ